MKTYPDMHFKLSTIPPNTLLTFKYDNYVNNDLVTGYLYVNKNGVPHFVNADFTCDENTQYITPNNVAYNVPNNTVTNGYNPDTNMLEYIVCEFNLYYSMFVYLARLHNTPSVSRIKTEHSGFITIGDSPSPVITNYYNKYTELKYVKEYIQELRKQIQIDFIKTAHRACELKLK